MVYISKDPKLDPLDIEILRVVLGNRGIPMSQVVEHFSNSNFKRRPRTIRYRIRRLEQLEYLRLRREENWKHAAPVYLNLTLKGKMYFGSDDIDFDLLETGP